MMVELIYFASGAAAAVSLIGLVVAVAVWGAPRRAASFHDRPSIDKGGHNRGPSKVTIRPTSPTPMPRARR